MGIGFDFNFFRLRREIAPTPIADKSTLFRVLREFLLTSQGLMDLVKKILFFPASSMEQLCVTVFAERRWRELMGLACGSAPRLRLG